MPSIFQEATSVLTGRRLEEALPGPVVPVPPQQRTEVVRTVEVPMDLAEAEEDYLRRLFARDHVEEPVADVDLVSPTASYYRTRVELSSNRIRRYKDFCLSGDTKILRLNGETPTIRELFVSGETFFWVYSYDVKSGRYVPGQVVEAVPMPHQYEHMLRVTLDNGESVNCTLNHPWLLRDGTYRKAEHLRVGDSLMPLYLGEKYRGTDKYTTILSDQFYQGRTHVHSWVAEALLSDDVAVANARCLEDGSRYSVVHHRDHNKLNNDPSNLQPMTLREHRKLHGDIIRKWNGSPEHLAKVKAADSLRKWKAANPGLVAKIGRENIKLAQASVRPGHGPHNRWHKGILFGECPLCHDLGLSRKEKLLIKEELFGRWEDAVDPSTRRRLAQIAAENGRRAKGNQHGACHNHKIVKIEEIPLEPVYDLVMEKHHNFALAAGVFVHNTDMGQDSLISGALDIYAEESTQWDPIEKTSVWVTSRNPEIQRELTDMLERIEYEENIYGLSRQLAQFGDCFVRPLYNRETGVVGLQAMDAEDVERRVDRYGRLIGFRLAGMKEDLDPWYFVHYRIIGRTQTVRQGGAVYGTSQLENARRAWRVLTLLEDALVIYRLEIGTRHRVFYIDVGNLDYERAFRVARRYKREFGKRTYYNALTGEWNSRFNPLHFTADLFWPIRKGSESRIDYIGTDPNIAGIADIEYMRSKLFAALKIPKAYIGLDEYSSVRTGLAQIDAGFGRFISRNQRACKRGTAQLCMIHLALRGYDVEKSENAFTIGMSPVSTLDQQQRLEAITMSADIADRLHGLGQSLDLPDDGLKNWIASNIMGLTPLDFQRIGQELNFDKSGGQHARTQFINSGLDEKQQRGLLHEALSIIRDDPEITRLVNGIRGRGFASTSLTEGEDGILPPSGSDGVSIGEEFEEVEESFYGA